MQEKDTFTMHEIGPRNKITNTETRAYDQIKGKDLVCLFDSAKIKQMDMSGNVQVIYFPVESDGGMTGWPAGMKHYSNASSCCTMESILGSTAAPKV